jgi:hypothetical protein
MKLRWMVMVSVVVGGLALAQTAAQQMTHKVVTPDQMKWGPAPPGLPPGGEAAVLSGNPTEPGLYVVRLRMPDGYKIRPHWHSKDENVTVISGGFSMGMGDKLDEAQMKPLPPGSYVALPARMHHFAMAKGETIVQLSNMGPFDITYINPTDDPRIKRSAR